jgi:hypothetical protein
MVYLNFTTSRSALLSLSMVIKSPQNSLDSLKPCNQTVTFEFCLARAAICITP